MINLDTNILVRVLTGDDPRQSPIARRFLAEECAPERPGFVSLVVLVELCWVLEESYRYTGRQIGEAVRNLTQFPSIRIEAHALVEQALQAMLDKGADFSDALIAAIGAAAGCSETVTFDRRFARQRGVRLLR